MKAPCSLKLFISDLCSNIKCMCSFNTFCVSIYPVVQWYLVLNSWSIILDKFVAFFVGRCPSTLPYFDIWIKAKVSWFQIHSPKWCVLRSQLFYWRGCFCGRQRFITQIGQFALTGSQVQIHGHMSCMALAYVSHAVTLVVGSHHPGAMCPQKDINSRN